ncbi:hypothetical protein F4808DRAFT_256196 [Astrocystis sublimbata]|nr:hypothetical protein F4808DRAFT_256196 [Astrocystis sublimbata]
MRATLAATLAGVAAASQGLSPSWSFASTTTITDKLPTWYTISSTFTTTFTTDVSGTIETITATRVSISEGTEPPVLPTIEASEPSTAISDLAPCTTAPVRAPKIRAVELLSSSTATGHLVTHTYSQSEFFTIDSTDVVPTGSPSTGADESTSSSPSATIYTVAGKAATTTFTVTAATSVSSISFTSSDEGEMLSGAALEQSTAVTFETTATATPSVIASSTATRYSTFSASASGATGGSSSKQSKSITATVFSTSLVVTETATSPSDTSSTTTKRTSSATTKTTSIIYYTSNSRTASHTSTSSTYYSSSITYDSESNTYQSESTTYQSGTRSYSSATASFSTTTAASASTASPTSTSDYDATSSSSSSTEVSTIPKSTSPITLTVSTAFITSTFVTSTLIKSTFVKSVVVTSAVIASDPNGDIVWPTSSCLDKPPWAGAPPFVHATSQPDVSPQGPPWGRWWGDRNRLGHGYPPAGDAEQAYPYPYPRQPIHPKRWDPPRMGNWMHHIE